MMSKTRKVLEASSPKGKKLPHGAPKGRRVTILNEQWVLAVCDGAVLSHRYSVQLGSVTVRCVSHSTPWFTPQVVNCSARARLVILEQPAQANAALRLAHGVWVCDCCSCWWAADGV